MERELVFVNSTGETFTPTKSGAIATWIWEVCRASQRSGWEPWVLTRTADADAYPWARMVALDYPFPPRFRGMGRVAALGRRLRGWGHICQGRWLEMLHATIRNRGWGKAVLVFHNDPELVAALRSRLPEARLVHVFHNCNASDARWRARFAGAVDVAFAVSRYCARWNEEYFGVPVHILRNGVDSERFRPLEKDDGRPPVIGFVGRTDRQKAPDLLLRAALKLSERTPEFRMQLLGSRFYGSHSVDLYQNQLDALCSKLEDRGVLVERPGFVNRLALPRVLARADIHVVPSRWEDPCPLTLLEGMATGQATVGSLCGGVPEVLGGDGFLFERDDVDGLESKLRVLVQNPEMRRSYGLRARERALQRPWSRVFSELLEVVLH